MDEGDVELVAGLFGRSAVAPEDNDLASGVEELVRLGRELVPPLGVERVEDVAAHLVDPAVVAAVREALRLAPLDVRVHVGEHSVEVVTGECLVGALDELEIPHARRLRAVRYAIHADDRPDGRLHTNELLTQRIVELGGAEHIEAADEVLYVLGGEGELAVGEERHQLRPGTAVFVAGGTRWTAGGVRALSVLVHAPPPPTAPFGVRDLTAEERGSATAGRQFVLGVRPELGCASATQFIGLVPPGSAPDHYHTYDEVIYILEGEGELHIGGETAALRPGSCVQLPAGLVHCLANTGDSELRLLGVFRPAGSPAEAYYPDGTPAAVSDHE